MEYNDLPTKEHIKKAISISNLDMKAIILFMVTSGTGKAETLSLKINDFIKATQEYHDNDGLYNILNTLKNQNNIVPTWYIKRIKTDKYYHTFNHPEATEAIIEYLMTRKNLSLSDMLFPLSSSLLLTRFQQINDNFDWGFKGKYRFFRSHILRKFHASNISINAEYIDALQGRSKNIIHETYIKTRPDALRKIYINAMDDLSLNKEIKEKNKFNTPINEKKENNNILVTLQIFNIAYGVNMNFNQFT
jgi:integrase